MPLGARLLRRHCLGSDCVTARRARAPQRGRTPFDPEKPQEVAHILRLGVATGIDATTGGEHIGLFALEQTFGTVRGVAEGHTGACDVIEIGL